jgi:hypothetical protein
MSLVYLAKCESPGCEPVRRCADRGARDNWAAAHERETGHRVWFRTEGQDKVTIYAGHFTQMVRRKSPHDPLTPEPLQ